MTFAICHMSYGICSMKYGINTSRFRIFARRIKMRREVSARSLLYLTIISFLLLDQSASRASTSSPSNWSSKFDSKVRFHQTTELGALIVGTEKSLYAIDGETGEILWRRKDVRLDESDVAPVVGTDLLLLSFEKGGKTRVEAVD